MSEYTIITSNDLNAPTDIYDSVEEFINLCMQEGVSFSYGEIDLYVNGSGTIGYRVSIPKDKIVVYFSEVGISINEVDKPAVWYTTPIKFETDTYGIYVCGEGITSQYVCKL